MLSTAPGYSKHADIACATEIIFIKVHYNYLGTLVWKVSQILCLLKSTGNVLLILVFNKQQVMCINKEKLHSSPKESYV